MTLFLSEKYLQEGVGKDGGTEEKTTFIRAAGINLPKQKAFVSLNNNMLANL